MALDDKLSNNDKSIMSIKLVGWSKFFFQTEVNKLLLQEEMEIVFMVVFTTEMLTKILALGFMLHKGSYMRNPWNFMDFFVVTSGWAPIDFKKKFIKWRLEAAEKNGLGGKWSSTTQLMVSPIEPQWIIQLGNQIWIALEVCKVQNYLHQKRIVFDARYFLQSSWEDKQIWSLWWRYRLQSSSCGGHSEFWQAELRKTLTE